LNPVSELTQAVLLRRARKFTAKKRLGQNFLIDPSKLFALTDSLDIIPGDIVIEIGPGLGFLTRVLLSRGAIVIAVELDIACVTNLLDDKVNEDLKNLHVLHGDFLSFDLIALNFAGKRTFLEGKQNNTLNLTDQETPQLDELRKLVQKHIDGGGKIKVAGNVPYQITAPILVHLLGEIGQPSTWLKHIDSFALTVQYEVAQRFTARPSTKPYSQITMLANYYCQPNIVQKVPNRCFFPIPDVQSAIVKFQPLAQPKVGCTNTKLLRQLIRGGFSSRRKMLKNNLGFLGYPQEELITILESCQISKNARAEELGLDAFGRLADRIQELRAIQQETQNN
jgi:16S rRNA (adenine1518-N6/adenine1519-N6)-dimethyltransferase